MPYFVINGKPDCPNFVHAIYVARYLADKLPNFIFKKVEKLSMDWAIYLEQLNKENDWYVTESPLIWKEISMWGGKKYLIGGLAQFWEHVYCYYGLESIIPKEELRNLASDNFKFFIENTEVAKQQDVLIITILGASSPLTGFVITELIQMNSLQKSQGIIFKLYDYYQNIDNKKFEIMIEYCDYFNSLKTFGRLQTVLLSETKKEVIKDADLIIHLEEFIRHEKECEELFLRRCSYRMEIFGDLLVHIANRSVKIILANSGPVCFLASCLLCACRPKKLTNIVAVTADKGFPYVKNISVKTGIPVSRISAPTVWGFVGVNHFVDIRNIIYTAEMYKPYKRSLISTKDSTLPQGTVHAEVRIMSYMLKNTENIISDVETFSKKLRTKLNRPPSFSKVRALVCLIKLWNAREVGDEIISLGVVSNGTFDTPNGVVFSQPVRLNQNRKWVPFTQFPLMNDVTKQEIKNCCTNIRPILKQFALMDYSDERKRSFETEEEFDAYEQYLRSLDAGGEQIQYWIDNDQHFLDFAAIASDY